MAKKKTQSIITNYTNNCMICGRPNPEIHHCPYGVSNHKIADREKLLFPLCYEHHRTGKYAAHKCKEVDVLLHIVAQLAWEKHYIAEKCEPSFEGIEEEAREKFRALFGKSYL